MGILYQWKRWRDTCGQDLIEYALMAGFLVVVAGAVIPGVGSSISAMFSDVASRLTKATTQAS